MCNPAAAMAASMVVSTGVKMAANAQAAGHESRVLEHAAKVAKAQGIEQERQLRQKAAAEQAKRRVAVLKRAGSGTELGAWDPRRGAGDPSPERAPEPHRPISAARG